MSNATARVVSRTNHLAVVAMTPEASVSTPMLWTKSAKPERRAKSSNLTARRSAATPRASSEEKTPADDEDEGEPDESRDRDEENIELT